MIQPQSDWLQWLLSWQQSQDSTRLGERVTRLEVHQERQEQVNQQTADRMSWLERGLQALAVLVLAMLAKSAPSSAGVLAELLIGIIKR